MKQILPEFGKKNYLKHLKSTKECAIIKYVYFFRRDLFLPLINDITKLI
jgi:hypothetical protein